jgi:Undecaprenyl-phosphate glucose phosphotransferase
MFREIELAAHAGNPKNDLSTSRLNGLLSADSTSGRTFRPWLSPRVVKKIVQIWEALLIIASALSIAVFAEEPAYLNNIHIWIVILAIGVAIPWVFQAFELYTFPALRGHPVTAAQAISIFVGLFAVTILIMQMIGFLLHVSSRWLVAWFLSAFILLMLSRFLIAFALRTWGHAARIAKTIAIVGAGPVTEDLLTRLERSGDDIKISGIYDDRCDDRVAAARLSGTIDDLMRKCLEHRIDYVIICLPLFAEDRLVQIVSHLWELPVHIRISAHTNKLIFRPHTYSYIGDVPLLDVSDRPISEWNYIAKTTLDWSVSCVALLLLSPVFAIIALAIKLDSPGPVFFVQKRIGFNNSVINVLKFRTLRQDQEDRRAAVLVTRNDKRVTHVGRFLRKTSLDELPQLFNVLRGDLSLVGPRPHAMGCTADMQRYEDVVQRYYARHRVKPGMTGWAQVNGWRGETDSTIKIEKRVECDLHYIEHWSIFFDLYILALTPVSLIKHLDRSY